MAQRSFSALLPLAILIAVASTSACCRSAAAVTPNSPEVIELVDKGIKFLEENTDKRLGGKCLVALAFLKKKEAEPNHPRVKEALEACRKGRTDRKIDMYSHGLAIIFLCELGPRKHADLIRHYLGALKRRQKGHGGWGYDEKKTGDTSQSQYAALSYWEAHNNGFAIESASVEKFAEWLMRTQDPGGAWGYQGHLSPNSERIKQSEITCSMLAAGMGSILIAADLFGLVQPGAADSSDEERYSSSWQVAGEKKRERAPNLRSSTLDRDGIYEAIKMGNKWMDKNYKEDIGRYNIYYLYSLERYKSFQEQLDGYSPEEPEWYQNGYKFLKDFQGADGSWNSGCDPAPDTAFAILFLVRSTKNMLNKGFAGRATGRNGLPKLTANVKVDSEGRLRIKQTQKAVSELIGMLDAEKSAEIDEIAKNPDAFITKGPVDEAGALRLRQIVRGGSPSARLIAVRTLGQTGDLDHVPTLIYAMTDPDTRVVIQARNGLRFISRRFGGYGLPDKFEDRERYDVIDKWKKWYLSIRPGATVSLN